MATAEMWDGAPYPEEAVYVQRSVQKRKREFAAGRLCMREALKRLGIARFPLLVAANRAPIWPKGIVGSISHCDGCCGAVVANEERVAGIGFDVESALPLSDHLLPVFCTRDELAWLSDHNRPNVPYGNIIFSAKESVYKGACSAGDELEFHDIRIGLNPHMQTFTATFANDTAPCHSLHGHYFFNERFVYTGVMMI